jgi:thiol-disulfide isomerase/thioredoxin
MKTVSKFSIICFFLSAAALTLAFLNTGLPSWVPVLVGFFAWFAGFIGVKIVTLPADMAASTLGVIAFGITLDRIQNSYPWFVIMLLLMSMVYSFRTALIRQMGYAKVTWWEPLNITLAVAAYVYVNLTVHAGWAGWVFPVPVLFLAAFSALGSIADFKSYKASAKKEYIVQEGKEAPPFSLPDHEGKTVVLGEYRNKQLVLLLFVRGDWCPSCHIMLRVYEKPRNGAEAEY